MSIITARRYHDISCGHRVHGHEGKCAHLHGHNYRIHFTVQGDPDAVGRVLDFSAIKSGLCDWLERYWDHKFLIWAQDPWESLLTLLDPSGVVRTPFNPTAERMAEYLLNEVGPGVLPRDVRLVEVVVEETRKCSAAAALTPAAAAPMPTPRPDLTAPWRMGQGGGTKTEGDNA